MGHVQTIDTATRLSVTLFLARIADEYPVASAFLYGSRARGDAGPESDTDLAVILNGPKGRTSAVAANMAGSAYDVMLETGLLVSPLPIWSDDWLDPSHHANPWLISNIKRDGIAL
jgi:predicted nucleotidyltransferase